MESLLENYKKYLYTNPRTNQIDIDFFLQNKLVLGEIFKFFYMDYTKLIDGMSRLNCTMKNFLRASDLLEMNITNLEFIYDNGCSVKENTSHVEFAHEYFKLAEIQCNCGKFKSALYNMNKAISIGEKFYSKDSKILREFYEIQTNIQRVL